MEESKKGKRKRDRNRGKTRVNGLTFTWCRALQCCVKVCPLVDMCFLWLVSYLYKVQLYFSLCCVVSYWCFNEVGYCHCVLHGLLQCLCTLPPCVKDIFFFLSISCLIGSVWVNDIIHLLPDCRCWCPRPLSDIPKLCQCSLPSPLAGNWCYCPTGGDRRKTHFQK